ncbi:MAG: four helix bundle protein [Ginsengibacter sp.]
MYKVAMEIGDHIWDLVDKWDYFNNYTLGKQFVKAGDSIALTIAKGDGRFFYKEHKNFNYHSRGSAYVCTSCLRKAVKRKLITKEKNLELRVLFEKYLKLINAYIKSIGQSEIKDQKKVTIDLLTNDSMTND